MKGGTSKSRTLWTFALTSLALVMVTLDNLVVTTALPVIRKDLGAGIESLEWTVNAYTLTFAVLLLTGSATGSAAGGCSRSGSRSSRSPLQVQRSRPRSTRSSRPAPSRASAARSSPP
jgi:hypothetical protein